MLLTVADKFMMHAVLWNRLVGFQFPSELRDFRYRDLPFALHARKLGRGFFEFVHRAFFDIHPQIEPSRLTGNRIGIRVTIAIFARRKQLRDDVVE